MARRPRVQLSKLPAAARIVPDASGDISRLRVFLVFFAIPALILFMARKPVDHLPSAAHAYAHTGARPPEKWIEEWPASTRAAHGRPIVMPAGFISDVHGATVVYSRAMFLARSYDSRPYWRYPRLAAGTPTNRATADLAIEHLIPCESGGKAVNRVDVNGKMSYGILQFQDWDEWERVSGITGDPDNKTDAIRMAEWAIENGMINHWTCSSILKIT